MTDATVPEVYKLNADSLIDGAMGKRLSDDPGLAEMKRMEYLMSKAPCIARLNDLAAYSAKDDEEEHRRSCAEMKEFLNRAYE